LVAAIGIIRTSILLHINVSSEGVITGTKYVPIFKELKTTLYLSLEVRSGKKGEAGAIITSNILWRDNRSETK
jgi:hypothetical protein